MSPIYEVEWRYSMRGVRTVTAGSREEAERILDDTSLETLAGESQDGGWETNATEIRK